VERQSERHITKGAVLITGAGRGIGQATACLLATAGYPLVLVSKTAKFLDATRRLCARAVSTYSLPMDVCDERQFAALRQLLDNQVPFLHAVINNAGVGHWSAIDHMSAESWDVQLDTNLRGPFLVIRETLPYFRRQGYGLYVNVGSDCSLVGMPQRAAYNASNFGLVGLTASLRSEVSANGIHACMIYPGKTDTHFREHQPGDRPGALHPNDVAEVIGFVVRQYPRMVVADISVFPRNGGLTGPRSFV